MVEFENPHLKDKSLEEKIEALGTMGAGEPNSPVFEMFRTAIQADLAERLAAPRLWAMVAAIAAAISAAAAVVSAIAAF
jgi:hypothetical protein